MFQTITMKKLTWLTVLIIFIAAHFYLYAPHKKSDLSNVERGAWQAQITRDRWGVPHIKGMSDADASFGLAYAHAQDDYDTIQEVISATRGELANYYGKKAAVGDYLVSFLNIWQVYIPCALSLYHHHFLPLSE